MPGTRSDPYQFVDRPVQRSAVRISNLYATPWHVPDEQLSTLDPAGDTLRLGRLDRYYRVSVDQIPRVFHHEDLDPAALAYRRWERPDCATKARLWLFATPSGQIVAGLTLDVDCALGDIVNLLEDCYYLDITADEGTPLERLIADLAHRRGGNGDSSQTFLPERHQVIFADAQHGDYADTVQRVIYRSDLPYRQEHSSIAYPAELNRRPGSVAAVGPFASCLCGQQDYVENSALLSAVQAVASTARLREIREVAYEAVRMFRRGERTLRTTRGRRRMLEGLSDQLGDLELELSHSVEASADLGLLVPSLRVEIYNTTLYASIGVTSKAATVGRMLERLERAITAELTAIESVERRADDDRQIRWTVAIGFVSTVAIPVSLVLAYLGINARQVDSRRSMFDGHYLGMYILTGTLMLIGAMLSAGLYFQQRRKAREPDPGPGLPRWGFDLPLRHGQRL